MKTVLLVCFAACAFAAPADPEKPVAQILSSENVVEHDGKFHYSFESDDGTKSNADGELKQVGPEPENVGESVRGGYSYTGDDGKTYSVSYIADENGFQPKGDHLPQAPPVPPAIARALAYLATLPPPAEDAHKN